MKKIIIVAGGALFLIFPLPALAQILDLGLDFVVPLNLPSGDPRAALVSLLGLALTFTGIIAVIIMLYGGFLWMVSLGNEDRAAQAKKTLGGGIIGLIIILSSFLIINFIITNVNRSLSS